MNGETDIFAANMEVIRAAREAEAKVQELAISTGAQRATAEWLASFSRRGRRAAFMRLPRAERDAWLNRPD